MDRGRYGSGYDFGSEQMQTHIGYVVARYGLWIWCREELGWMTEGSVPACTVVNLVCGNYVFFLRFAARMEEWIDRICNLIRGTLGACPDILSNTWKHMRVIQTEFQLSSIIV